MLLFFKKGKLFSLTFLFLATDANAMVKHAEISAAGGIAWYQKHDTHLMISSFETDNIKVSQSTTHGAWKVGLGYPLLEDTLPYFNRLLLNLNIYQTSTTLRGVVWQYGQSQFDNYDFKAPTKSTRLMLDLKPSFFTWQSTEPYVILGIGAAWNSLAYREAVAATDININSILLLSKRTTSYLAWDFGAGYKIALTNHLSASVEYIYAILGHSSPAHDPGGVLLAVVPKFSLQNQSLLLGLNLAL